MMLYFVGLSILCTILTKFCCVKGWPFTNPCAHISSLFSSAFPFYLAVRFSINLAMYICLESIPVLLVLRLVLRPPNA